jgi:hypothetical protein
MRQHASRALDTVCLSRLLSRTLYPAWWPLNSILTKELEKPMRDGIKKSGTTSGINQADAWAGPLN